MPSQAEFKILANKRLDEAKTLQQAGHYEAAFYLAGYAVECGLKAAVCKTLQIDIFEKEYSDLQKSFKVHRLDQLIVLSGLSRRLALDAAAASTPSLSFAQDQFAKPPSDVAVANWDSWNEQIRYNATTCNAGKCQNFVNNVEQFLTWLRNHW